MCPVPWRETAPMRFRRMMRLWLVLLLQMMRLRPLLWFYSPLSASSPTIVCSL